MILLVLATPSFAHQMICQLSNVAFHLIQDESSWLRIPVAILSRHYVG